MKVAVSVIVVVFLASMTSSQPTYEYDVCEQDVSVCNSQRPDDEQSENKCECDRYESQVETLRNEVSQSNYEIRRLQRQIGSIMTSITASTNNCGCFQQLGDLQDQLDVLWNEVSDVKQQFENVTSRTTPPPRPNHGVTVTPAVPAGESAYSIYSTFGILPASADLRKQSSPIGAWNFHAVHNHSHTSGFLNRLFRTAQPLPVPPRSNSTHHALYHPPNVPYPTTTPII